MLELQEPTIELQALLLSEDYQSFLLGSKGSPELPLAKVCCLSFELTLQALIQVEVEFARDWQLLPLLTSEIQELEEPRQGPLQSWVNRSVELQELTH